MCILYDPENHKKSERKEEEKEVKEGGERILGCSLK